MKHQWKTTRKKRGINRLFTIQDLAEACNTSYQNIDYALKTTVDHKPLTRCYGKKTLDALKAMFGV